jgi:hypothetical protein
MRANAAGEALSPWERAEMRAVPRGLRARPGVHAAMLLAALAGLASACAADEGGAAVAIDTTNYILGTQTFSPAYQLTDEAPLIETAGAILDMGSNLIKFRLSRDYFGGRNNAREETLGVDSLVQLVRDEPTHRRVLEMPFAYYILWAYTFHGGWWADGFDADEQEREYREIYDLARHLLTAYAGTGKRFYLGHWEGDWHLRQGYDAGDDSVVKPEAVQGMIDWLNTRQRAIDDAKRDTPHEGVEVYGYCEVNLVRMALDGRPCVTNSVLPHTNVDFVSYSSYDSGVDLGPALDCIAAKLAPKEGLPGKRVFIGEYGKPSLGSSPEEQDAHARAVIRSALQWGCPFVLYWELYNNEVDDQGRQRGFWMIDDQGVRQPVYETHRRYYEWARAFVADAVARTGEAPSEDALRAAALAECFAPE